MNGLYARDTSNKSRAVKLSTFKAGKYVGCYAPLGFRKIALILNAKNPRAQNFLLHGGGQGRMAGENRRSGTMWR